jgi:hypothetical protein
MELTYVNLKHPLCFRKKKVYDAGIWNIRKHNEQ